MRNPFLELLTTEATDVPGTFWATVTGVDPLRVQRDGEPVLAITPTTLATLAVGDRVLCLLERRQVVVLGKMGGPTAAYPAPNTVTIDGTDYPLSGSVAVPTHTWSGTSPVYYTTVNVPIPYTPPSFWTFIWSVQESIGYSFAQNGARFPSGGTQMVRLFQIAHTGTDRIKRLQWQLVAR